MRGGASSAQRAEVSDENQSFVLFDIFWQMFERKVEVREENG